METWIKITYAISIALIIIYQFIQSNRDINKQKQNGKTN